MLRPVHVGYTKIFYTLACSLVYTHLGKLTNMCSFPWEGFAFFSFLNLEKTISFSPLVHFALKAIRQYRSDSLSKRKINCRSNLSLIATWICLGQCQESVLNTHEKLVYTQFILEFNNRCSLHMLKTIDSTYFCFLTDQIHLRDSQTQKFSTVNREKKHRQESKSHVKDWRHK